MCKLIKSRTFNQYIKENQIVLTDLQKAVILVNSEISMKERDEELSKIAAVAENEKLKQELIKFVQDSRQKYEKETRNSGDYVFVVEQQIDSDTDYTANAVFRSFEAAQEYGNGRCCLYCIRKYRIFDSAAEQEAWNEKNWSEEITIFLYNNQHQLIQILSAEEDQTYDFQDQYVKIPHPFRKGDLVIQNGDFGIVYGEPENEKEYQNWLKDGQESGYDASDIQLTTYFYNQREEFWYHRHVRPWELEKPEINEIPEEEFWRLTFQKFRKKCLEYV